MVRETYPAAKVRWIREEGQEDLGSDPLDEPGTMWVSGELYEAIAKRYAAQSAPRRGK